MKKYKFEPLFENLTSKYKYYEYFDKERSKDLGILDDDYDDIKNCDNRGNSRNTIKIYLSKKMG